MLFLFLFILIFIFTFIYVFIGPKLVIMSVHFSEITARRSRSMHAPRRPE